jgi:hypothetical protein
MRNSEDPPQKRLLSVHGFGDAGAANLGIRV